MSVFYNDVFVFSSLESQRHYCAFLYTVSIRKGCFSKVSQLLFKGKRAKTHRLFLEGGLLCGELRWHRFLLKELRPCGGVEARSIGSSDQLQLAQRKITYFIIVFLNCFCSLNYKKTKPASSSRRGHPFIYDW